MRSRALLSWQHRLRLRTTTVAMPALLLAGPGLLVGSALPAAAEEPPGPPGGAALAAPGVVAPAGAPPLPPKLTATAWLVADLDTGEVLAAKGAHTRLAPASTLKMLTAVTLIPRVPAEQMVVPTFDDLNVDGSKVGLKERIAYPARELFESLMVVSANDAANTLASAGGGHAESAALMNAEALRLGAVNTHAVNSSGLDAPGQVSTPYDLALIARAGMAMPDFRRYVTVRRSSVTAPKGKRFEIYTHNKLLLNYPGAIGIKNGYTSRAKASFVGAAERDGRRLVVALMRGQPRLWTEAEMLLDWGFAARAAGVAPVGQLVEPPAPPPVEVPAAEAAPDEQAAVPAAVAVPLPKPAEEEINVPLILGTIALLAVITVWLRRKTSLLGPPRG